MLQEGERLAIELNDQRSLAILYSMLSLYHIQTGGGQGIEYGAKAFEAADQIQDLELMATTGFDLS
jgi:hypothetical protein